MQSVKLRSNLIIKQTPTCNEPLKHRAHHWCKLGLTDKQPLGSRVTYVAYHVDVLDSLFN